MAYLSSLHHPSGAMCVSLQLSCLVHLSVFLTCGLCSLNEVHRSSTIGHVLIYPIFIHRILLFLGLADFPTSEPVHVVGPLVATFL